jgi:hypothetical protein
MNHKQNRKVIGWTLKLLAAIAALAIISPSPAIARWGGGGFGGGGFGGGGGFRGGGGRFGSDGFNRGAWGGDRQGSWQQHQGGDQNWQSHQGGSQNWQHQNQYGSSSSSPHASASTAYNTYHQNQVEEQQAQYNEMNTLQQNNEQTQKEMHNQTMSTLNNNWGSGPYSDCCWGSSGDSAGAAMMGMMGGMAMGATMASAANKQPSSNTTIIENGPPPPAMGTMVYSLPPGATATTVNGSTFFVSGSTYYRPFYSGSQVVYIVSQP